MSFWKKCPLLAAVIVSGLVIEGAGVANGVKSGEIENPASWKQPALATVFIDLKQGVYPWSDRSVQTAAMDAADVQKDRITEETGGQTNEENGGEKAGQMANADRDADHKNGTGDENEAGVSGNAVPGKAAEETQEAEEEPLEFTHVDKEYFEDAVFIGDSITIGWKNYNNRMLEKNPEFFGNTRFLCEGSYGVGHALEPISDSSLHPVYGGEQCYIWDAVKKMGAKKVFILFGLNDISIWGVQGTADNYAEVISNIRRESPETEIYVISAMYMFKGSEREKLNNKNIYALNKLLAEMCRENGYEFVNIASNLIDEGGFLPKEYCSDNYVHQTYSAYAVWADVLRSLAARHITGQGKLVFE